MLNKDEIIKLNREYNINSLNRFGFEHIQEALKVLQYDTLEELSEDEIVMMYKALFIITNMYLVDQLDFHGEVH